MFISKYLRFSTCWKTFVLWRTVEIVYYIYCYSKINSGHAIWRHGTWSALFQVVACYLMATNHHLNQCWLVSDVVLWHSPNGSFTGKSLTSINKILKFEKHCLLDSFKSAPVDRWKRINVRWQDMKWMNRLNELIYWAFVTPYGIQGI